MQLNEWIHKELFTLSTTVSCVLLGNVHIDRGVLEAFAYMRAFQPHASAAMATDAEKMSPTAGSSLFPAHPHVRSPPSGAAPSKSLRSRDPLIEEFSSPFVESRKNSITRTTLGSRAFGCGGGMLLQKNALAFSVSTRQRAAGEPLSAIGEALASMSAKTAVASPCVMLRKLPRGETAAGPAVGSVAAARGVC